LTKDPILINDLSQDTIEEIDPSIIKTVKPLDASSKASSTRDKIMNDKGVKGRKEVSSKDAKTTTTTNAKTTNESARAKTAYLIMDIERETIESKVMMYAKSTCPHCMKAKQLLNEKGIEFNFKDLDKLKNGQEIQDALFVMTKQKTVPNIFINSKHLGGNSDLVKANKSGELDSMLDLGGDGASSSTRSSSSDSKTQ
jgi:glutaredoxin 3